MLSGCMTKQPVDKCLTTTKLNAKNKHASTPKTLMQYLNKQCESIEIKKKIIKNKKQLIQKKRIRPKLPLTTQPLPDIATEPEEPYIPSPATGRIHHSVDHILSEKKAPESTGIITNQPRDAGATQFVRDYDPKRPVRVVGPTYLHTPSMEADQPVPDQTDAQ